MSFLRFLFLTWLLQTALLPVAVFVIKQENKIKELNKYYLYALIIWTIIGFYFMLDNNSDFGCLINNWSVFSLQNTGYSSISITLLVLALIFRSGKLQGILLFIELIYWLFKLFIIKGGYAVGIAAAPNITVVYFDTIALFLRLLVLYNSLNYKFSIYILFIPVFAIIFIRFL